MRAGLFQKRSCLHLTERLAEGSPGPLNFFLGTGPICSDKLEKTRPLKALGSHCQIGFRGTPSSSEEGPGSPYPRTELQGASGSQGRDGEE